MTQDNIFTICIDSTIEVIIGVYDKEREKKQKINFLLFIDYSYKENYLDYMEIHNFVKNTLQDKEYFLLETAIEDISKNLKQKFYQIEKIDLTLKKLEVIEQGILSVRKKFLYI